MAGYVKNGSNSVPRLLTFHLSDFTEIETIKYALGAKPYVFDPLGLIYNKCVAHFDFF